MHITHIIKRDGTLKTFKEEKIVSAICKAMDATKTGSRQSAEKITQEVITTLSKMKQIDSQYVPS
ncbi:MAG TPA: ribonucleotide reductase, partial [Thiomicrospira sp.]|nr:ribonucleotide reductase [Thiomicrospira sp.]